MLATFLKITQPTHHQHKIKIPRKCKCHSLLAVLVLLAVGGETLGLQELSSSSSLTEGALVLIQHSLLFLQGGFLICMEALQLLKATLQLKKEKKEENTRRDTEQGYDYIKENKLPFHFIIIM